MEPEMIFSLTVGQLRELLAYEDAGDLIDDVWSCVDEDDLARIGFYDDEEDDEDYDGDSSYYDDNYDEDEDTDYDEDDECYDDEDYCDEEEEDDLYLDEDEVCLGDVLPNFVEEEMAQSIAADIREGKYTFNAIKGFYADYILERIYQLI
jgi:hypothetical protein